MDPTAPIEQSSIPNTYTPSSKPKANSPILWLLAFILVGLGGFIIGKSLTQPEPMLPVPPYPIQSTTSPDPFADWKTFKNTKFGYQFKYPESWLINRGPGESSDEELGKTRSVDIYSGASQDVSSLGLSFRIDTNQLDQLGNEKNCEDLEDCITKSTSFFPEEIIRSEETFLGQPAIRINYDRKTDLYTQTFSNLFVILNDDFYEFQMIVQNGDFLQNRIVFDQILSTFTFLDQSNSSCPQGFNFYKDDYISVCIPIDSTPSGVRITDSFDRPGEKSYYQDFEYKTPNGMRLTINNDFSGGWGGQPCKETQTTLTTFPATQYQIGDNCNQIGQIITISDRTVSSAWAVSLKSFNSVGLNVQNYLPIVSTFSVINEP